MRPGIIVIVLLSLASTSSTALAGVARPWMQDFGWVEGQALFADVSAQAGIDAIYTRPDGGPGALLPTGQAWGDYDRDGWLDLYVTDQAGSNTLYHNEQDGSFSISPSSETVALADAQSSGAVFADYDNDGWSDLYVLALGGNTLFHNEGGTGFSNVTAQAGVGDSGKGSTASWGDYDRDGFLDLYVTNLGCRCDDLRIDGIDRLYHNDGDGTFTDVSQALGEDQLLSGVSFAASFADSDNDGDLDLYVVNDVAHNANRRNILWRNDGPGCGHWCFSDISGGSGTGLLMGAMGLATSDYDNDGDLDFYISNASNMVLLQNQGDGTFIDQATEIGVVGADNPARIGWGTLAFDIDNDGLRDFYMALSAGGSDLLYLNNGDETFTNLTPASPGEMERSGYLAPAGAAYADYDNDGWVDLLVGRLGSRYVLYRNQSAMQGQNHWLTVNLVGGGPVNRDAIGGRVYVTTSDGVSQMQEVKSGSSLGAGNALALYFGVGQETIETLRVVWPDGLTQTFENMAYDQQITLDYPVES